MARRWWWWLCGALGIAALSVILVLSLQAQVQRGTVSDRQAAIALSVAMQKIGAEYVWSSRGPDTFDSSGIYIYAYRQAVPNLEFQVSGGWWPRYAPDASHKDIYGWNFEETALADMRPGDLVYISDGTAEVTHGMMFVEWVEPGTIMRVLDASSRLMRVTTQEWPVNETVRGQKLVAAGRLSIKFRKDGYRHEPNAP